METTSLIQVMRTRCKKMVRKKKKHGGELAVNRQPPTSIEREQNQRNHQLDKSCELSRTQRICLNQALLNSRCELVIIDTVLVSNDSLLRLMPCYLMFDQNHQECHLSNAFSSPCIRLLWVFPRQLHNIHWKVLVNY